MKKVDRLRLTKLYRPEEAARIAETSSANVRRWLHGYTHVERKMEPVFGEPVVGSAIVSFLQLCELSVVAAFRSEGVTLKVLRRAHQYARDKFELEYPFASLELKKHGSHVLHEFEKELGKEKGLVLDQKGQITLPGMVKARALQFDFDPLDTFAYRWFLYGRDVPVVIDPRFGSGLPTIEGRNLKTDTLVGRHKSGQNLASIADDFQLPLGDIKKVLEHAA